MNKFEQLIEYVINDEEQKARDLFHEIVVEKSRGIYEELMAEEEIEEAKDEDEELDEAKEEDEELDESKEEDEELDESKEEDEDEELDESMMDEMGGDQSDDLIDDIETEEQGLSMEGEDEEGGDLENRVVDLEDKLDELMAEFEALMGDDGQEGEDEMDIEVGSDDIETDGMGPGEEEDMDSEFETMEGAGLEEAISLKSAPAPTKSEEGNINKKSVVAANSGQKGMEGKPVKASEGNAEGGKHDSPAYKNTTKDLIGKVGNTPAQSTQKLTPATKPHLAQATGVNNKSPL
jgi:hypothetical protein